MRIFIILLLFMNSCKFINTEDKKIGDLFFYEDVLNYKNPKLIGELYLRKNKLIFIQETKKEPEKEKIKEVKFLFNEINVLGYLSQIVPGKSEYSLDKKIVISKGGYNIKAIYISDKNFWNDLNLELEKYEIQIKFSDKH